MLSLILTLVVIGFLLFLLLKVVPMPALYSQVVVGIVCLFALLYALKHLGIALP